LIDGEDIVLVTESMYAFAKMLDNKIKETQTMGRIYIDPIRLKE